LYDLLLKERNFQRFKFLTQLPAQSQVPFIGRVFTDILMKLWYVKLHMWIEKSIKVGQGPIRTVEAS